MKKVIHPYNVEKHPVFCKIEYNNGRLSISGVEGPRRGGNAWGACGQIIMGFKEFDSRGYKSIKDIEPANGMTRKDVIKFLKIWDEWHLNHMHAECEHQETMGWRYDDHKGMYRPAVARNEKTQEKHNELISLLETCPPNYEVDGYKLSETGELLTWDEYRGHECPVCGYSIGSAWTFRQVPNDVLEFLESLPETDITPDWV